MVLVQKIHDTNGIHSVLIDNNFLSNLSVYNDLRET